MKKNRNTILFSIFVVCLVMIIGIYFTYAFFKSVYLDSDKKTTTNVVTGRLNVDFETSEYIKNDNVELVDESNYLTDADCTKFTVSKSSDSTANTIYYNIYLTDISISDNLKSKYFVWKLIDDDSNTVATGDFSNVSTGDTIQLNESKITLSGSDGYSIYIYLKNDENINQLDLLNGTFKAKVSIETFAD